MEGASGRLGRGNAGRAAGGVGDLLMSPEGEGSLDEGGDTCGCCGSG